MPEYLVVWRIDLDADTPEEAAQKALEIQRDPNSIATWFSVSDDNNNITIVNALERDTRDKNNGEP